MEIDVNFDFFRDAPDPKPEKWDPDASSPTLLRYHQLLWSKPLRPGVPFDLTPTTRPRNALVHDSPLGSFYLTSDSVLPTLSRRPEMQAILRDVPPDDIKYFNTITYTIGGMMLWPGKMIGGQTINQTRGSRVLYDRFDLTVECIRRHYDGDTTHPLAEVLGRYRSFFDLFLTFEGYIDFWLLDDLVDLHGNVKLFLPSEDFTLSPLPQSATDYLSFRDRTVEFVTARNERIRQLGL